MSSKIDGVPRELLPCPFCGKDAKLETEDVRGDNAWCFIRCSWRCKVAPHVGEHACIWYWSEGKKYRMQSDDEAKEKAREYAVNAWNNRVAPPELAELQATIAQLRIDLSNQTELTKQANYHKAQRTEALNDEIARLTAENERLLSGFWQQVTDADLKKIADFVSDGDLPTDSFFMRKDAGDLANMTMHMVREVQALRNEIERLKAGQGEPVAFRRFDGEGKFDYWDDEDGKGGSIHFPIEPLFTSQPASVSVEAAKAFAKGFNTLESNEGKYKIVMQFAGRDDAWDAFKALSVMTDVLPNSEDDVDLKQGELAGAQAMLETLYEEKKQLKTKLAEALEIIQLMYTTGHWSDLTVTDKAAKYLKNAIK